MKVTRTGKRRAAAINSVKVLLTSATLAATMGGWAVISSANGAALQVAQLIGTTGSSSAVQDWVASRGGSVATITAATTTVTTQVTQPTVRTRSSR